MDVRIVKTKELEKCIKHELWGANNNFKQWQIGDILIVTVDRKFVAIAEVTGEVFMDDLRIWEGDYFPYRIPIKFNCILNKDNMIPYNSEITNILKDEWGYNYGWGILAKKPLSKKNAEKLLSIILKKSGK